MLTVKKLEAGYNGVSVVALDAVTVGAGESCLLTGASGCGKTTLLYTIGGLMPALRGTVVFDAQNISIMNESARDAWRAKNVGIVFQTLHLVQALSVFDNILLGAYAAHMPQDRARAASLLERLGVSSIADRRPSEISQGQAQRVAVARALMNRPRLLLADEPTSSLDDASAAQVIGLLTELAHENNAALLVSSHDSRINAHFTKTVKVGA